MCMDTQIAFSLAKNKVPPILYKNNLLQRSKNILFKSFNSVAFSGLPRQTVPDRYYAWKE